MYTLTLTIIINQLYSLIIFFFFFNDTATTEIYTLSLHDALPIAEIQADIINSLYSPHGQSADSTVRHATRVVKSLVEFRRQLPERYKRYFGVTADWSLEEKTKLVQEITEDEGLTLLKIGIARILLLRALFSNKDLEFPQRHKALLDGELTISKRHFYTLSLISTFSDRSI